MPIATCLLWSQGSDHEERGYTLTKQCVEELYIALYVAGVCMYLNW